MKTTKSIWNMPHGELPAEVLEQMNREGYASLESQQQYWIDKEAESDNATPETRDVWIVTVYDNVERTVLSAFSNYREANEYGDKHRPCTIEIAMPQIPASNASTTADPKPKTNDDLSRTESACDWFDHQIEGKDWSLRDGQGMSYGERNV